MAITRTDSPARAMNERKWVTGALFDEKADRATTGSSRLGRTPRQATVRRPKRSMSRMPDRGNGGRLHVCPHGRLPARGPGATMPALVTRGRPYSPGRTRMKRSSLIILLAVALCTIPRMAIGSTHDGGSVRGHSSAARTLAVRSDFNGDGYSDLAVGEADEDVGTIVDAGGVNVIYGSISGLNAKRNQFWTQNAPGILDQSEQSDAFGRAV